MSITTSSRSGPLCRVMMVPMLSPVLLPLSLLVSGKYPDLKVATFMSGDDGAYVVTGAATILFAGQW